jgi:hypothetical protein
MPRLYKFVYQQYKATIPVFKGKVNLKILGI